jgi:hypothetical protein
MMHFKGTCNRRAWGRIKLVKCASWSKEGMRSQIVISKGERFLQFQLWNDPVVFSIYIQDLAGVRNLKAIEFHLHKLARLNLPSEKDKN